MMPPTSIDGTDITGATIDGTDVEEITVDGQTVFSAGPPPGAFDIVNYTFDKAVTTFQSGSGIFWSNDGTQFFQIISNTNEVVEFPAATPFDIGSLGSSTTFSLPTTSDSNYGLMFSDTGDRMFVSEDLGGDTVQYDLNAPFDLSTITQSGSVSTTGRVFDITFSQDGTEYYSVDIGDNFHQRTLSTPFDLTTAGPKTTVSDIQNNSYGIAISNDGSKLFQTGGGNSNEIYQINLNTPFDITSIGSHTVFTNSNYYYGLQFSNTGDKFWMSEYFTGNEVVQWSL